MEKYSFMIKFEITREVSAYIINAKDLQNIEEIQNCKLPEDYKKFLLSHNGGKPLWSTFDIKNCFLNGEPIGSSVRFFYGICLDTKSIMHLYDIFDNIKCYNNRVPNELLPIGTDSFGNNICLCIKGDNYGKIYFWDHEGEAAAFDPHKSPWWDNVYFIADSFTDFIKGLYNIALDDHDSVIKTYQDGTVIHE
jgi:hypothetical protein